MNIARKLKQTLVYWAPDAPDGAGNPSYGEPSEIACRWSARRELFTNRNKEQQLSNGIVHVENAGVLVENGFVFLGALSDISGPTGDPNIVADTFIIGDIKETPSLDATQTVTKAWLAR